MFVGNPDLFFSKLFFSMMRKYFLMRFFLNLISRSRKIILKRFRDDSDHSEVPNCSFPKKTYTLLPLKKIILIFWDIPVRTYPMSESAKIVFPRFLRAPWTDFDNFWCKTKGSASALLCTKNHQNRFTELGEILQNCFSIVFFSNKNQSEGENDIEL